MTTTIPAIPPVNLALAFIPVFIVLIILYRWSLNAKDAVYALVRMLIQLLLVGYVLTGIFNTQSAWVVMSVMFVMVIASTWIALGTVKRHRLLLFQYGFTSITVGGGFTLALVTQGVIQLDPWFEPRYMVPLAGMIFANAMNSISLAAERLQAELSRNERFNKARNRAFQAAFIPVINSLLAVGLVSLPGMMTGQILSGVSPVTAAHYQIVVMCMVFGSTGLSTAFFLMLIKDKFHST